VDWSEYVGAALFQSDFKSGLGAEKVAKSVHCGELKSLDGRHLVAVFV
jgi:hypothetical protein